MEDLLLDCINTLANYRLLLKKTGDAVGAQVVTQQIEEIKKVINNQINS